MKTSFATWTIILIIITGCAVAISAFVYASSVPHHGLDVDTSDADACLGCHDGTIGKTVSFCTVGCNASSPHVIHKHYPPAGKHSQFNPISSVRERGVILVNDEVVCISCHNIANQQKYHLVIDNSGSGLCLVCHRK